LKGRHFKSERVSAHKGAVSLVERCAKAGDNAELKLGEHNPPGDEASFGDGARSSNSDPRSRAMPAAVWRRTMTAGCE
jgi:hypothetical protein